MTENSSGALASAGHEPIYMGMLEHGHHHVECSCGWDNCVDPVVGVMGRPATWPEHLDAEEFTGQVVLHAGTPSELRDALYALEAESMHARIPEWLEAYPQATQALAYAQGFSAALEVLPAIHNGRAVHVGRVTVQGRPA